MLIFDLRGKELCSTSMRVEYLYKLFGILLHGRFVSFPNLLKVKLYSVIYQILSVHQLMGI